MTYNEKKSLYESIMKDVAKIVKHQINESEIELPEPFKTNFEEGISDYLDSDINGPYVIATNGMSNRQMSELFLKANNIIKEKRVKCIIFDGRYK